mgnify:CR=1 FL=1
MMRETTLGAQHLILPLFIFDGEGRQPIESMPGQSRLGHKALLEEVGAALGDGIGANDVDGGHTTLVSPVIDLTPYENPVMTYWRWYANAPATGANPASDWWQVEITNDGGNTWQYLENTLQQDIAWRRKAFRVADVIEPTDAFQMRFIASDSTTLGEYLDGGSLVEAALDLSLIHL